MLINFVGSKNDAQICFIVCNGLDSYAKRTNIRWKVERRRTRVIFFSWDGTGKFVSIVRRKSGQQKFFKFNKKLFSYKINNILVNLISPYYLLKNRRYYVVMWTPARQNHKYHIVYIWYVVTCINSWVSVLFIWSLMRTSSIWPW